MVTFGVDWNADNQAFTEAKVLAFSPLIATQVAQPARLGPFNQAQMMTRLWYSTEDGTKDNFDQQPGKVGWLLQSDATAASKVFGEFWVTYRVRLSGTTA